MSVRIHHGPSDEITDEFAAALATYEADHPSAQIDLYRHSSVSIRLRIVDPDFAEFDRVERHDKVWAYFDRLPEDTLAELSMVLLLTPDELRDSFANVEFEDPVPSRL